MQEMERLAAQLPTGVGYEWTGMSFEERLSGAQAPALYAISLIVVFLCLAALYESWSIPSAVMLVVPLGIIGALAATLLRGLSNDVYFQVGLLTTVGLAAKNAILIVEFAKSLRVGAGLIESAIHAARQLRPILMTSLAFILGVVPLAISSGAGSGSQNAIGTGVIGGMLTATFLAIFFVPTFFVVMLKLFKVKRMSEQRDKHKPTSRRRDLRNDDSDENPVVRIPGGGLARWPRPTSARTRRSAPPIRPARPTSPTRSTPGVATADVGWRDFFTDPLLQRLIEMSLANNRDLRVAALNVEAARAIPHSAFQPDAQRRSGRQGNRAAHAGSLTPSGEATTSHNYQVGAALSTWELDLFGRIRSLSDKALESYLALDETRTATQLSLVAEVANAT